MTEKTIQNDLYNYLRSKELIDEQLPECADLEQLWATIGEAYLPDGIREFSAYPTVSLGWMMFIGMAVAKYWDTDWNKYSTLSNLYENIRNKRGYDCMDEYILEEVLEMTGEELTKLNNIVVECASRTYNKLFHANIEAGTAEAFKAYVSCLHQLYLMGIAVQLKRMGYHMTLLEQ